MINWRKPLIYLLSFIQGSKRMKYFHKILEYDKFSEGELKDLQQKNLAKLLLHAYENVPYYKKILGDAGVVEEDFVNLDNFEKIPFLTKDIIRREGDNLYSQDYKARKPYENTSGGSTGEPVKFIQDKMYIDWTIANKMYYRHLAGQEIGEKELRFWGSERDLLEGKETFIMRFRNFMFNRIEFNTFRMSNEEMATYIDKWNAYKPHWVESYVQSAFEFAKYVKESGKEIYSPDNGILTSAGTLEKEKREMIEDVFQCKVYNRYGSREVGDMACGIGDLKLSVWNHYIEIIDSKIYVTLLVNYSMPLIRYEIGDLGEFDSKWGYIKGIKGRINSVIRTKKRTVDSAAITSMFYYRENGDLFTSFSRYQVIQKTIDYIQIRAVVNNEELWKEESKEIAHLFAEVFGEEVTVEFEIVDEIQPSKSGKYLFVMNEMES